MLIAAGFAAGLTASAAAADPWKDESGKRGPAHEDRRGHDRPDGGRYAAAIPPGHLPPPGLCRFWYRHRPPGHQPPPTRCAAAARTALRTGGEVIGGSRRNGHAGYAGYGPYVGDHARDTGYRAGVVCAAYDQYGDCAVWRPAD